jgi:divalent metal cation (Fe/Co/Zn/Cd) transporter
MGGGTSPGALMAIRLEYATIAWNVMEVGVTIALGIAARSLALIAFGLDSVVEIGASSVVIWQLRRRDLARTMRALALVGLAFFALSAVLLVGSVASLVDGRRPDDSVPGVVYLAVTAVVMFSLSFAKRRIGVRLGEHPLAHEARITFLDGLLATGVLLALVVNLAFGWWWADAIAAAMVGVAAIPEGVDAWRDSRDPSRIENGQSTSIESSSPESTS